MDQVILRIDFLLDLSLLKGTFSRNLWCQNVGVSFFGQTFGGQIFLFSVQTFYDEHIKDLILACHIQTVHLHSVLRNGYLLHVRDIKLYLVCKQSSITLLRNTRKVQYGHEKRPWRPVSNTVRLPHGGGAAATPHHFRVGVLWVQKLMRQQ